MKITNIVLYPLQVVRNYYIQGSWGLRVVYILTGAVGATLLYLFLKNKPTPQPPAQPLFPAAVSTGFELYPVARGASQLEVPGRKVEDIKFLNDAFGSFKSWLDEKIEELDEWKPEDSGPRWLGRVTALNGLKKELKGRLECIVNDKMIHQTKAIYEALDLQEWRTIQQWADSKQIPPKKGIKDNPNQPTIDEWGIVLNKLKELIRLDAARRAYLVDLVKSELSMPSFENLEAYLKYLAPEGEDRDHFGIQRSDFSKVGFCKMKDLDALKVRNFEGCLHALRQDEAILRWAEGRQEDDFNNLRTAAKRDMAAQIEAWRSENNQVDAEMKAFLDNMEKSLLSGDVKTALDKLENQNKKRQCALLKSHILNRLTAMAESQLQDVKVATYAKIDDYLTYLAPDGDCFGMKREDFFAVGLYTMADIDALELRNFDQHLLNMRQGASVFERAQKSSEGVFLALIPEAKEVIRGQVDILNQEIDQMRLRVSGFKEDPALSLTSMQVALQELVVLLVKAELQPSELHLALDKIEAQNKSRQCAFLKSYILQQDMRRAWESITLPSLADYRQQNQITDPYLLYSLGVSIVPPAQARYVRLNQ